MQKFSQIGEIILRIFRNEDYLIDGEFDVLLICHDNDLSSFDNGEHSSPIIHTIQDELTLLGFSSALLGSPGSKIRSRLVRSGFYKLNREYYLSGIKNRLMSIFKNKINYIERAFEDFLVKKKFALLYRLELFPNFVRRQESFKFPLQRCSMVQGTQRSNGVTKHVKLKIFQELFLH
jgi:hypothetical protein